MNDILEHYHRRFAVLVEKGAIDILVGSFLTKIATFLGSIVVVRLLSVEDYGLLSFAENKYTYVYLLAGLGLNNAVFRYIVKAKTLDEKKSVFNHVMKQGTLYNIIIVITAMMLITIIRPTEGFEKSFQLLPALILALPFQYIFDTCTYSLRALFKNRLYAISAVLAITIVWSTKIVSAKVVGLSGVVFSTTVSYMIMALSLVTYFGRQIFVNAESSALESEKAREMLIFSLQYMVTNGLWVLFIQNDLLLLGSLTANPSVVACYRVAYVIPSALSILSSSIGTFVVPYFVKHEDDKVWVWSHYKKVVSVSLFIVGAASLVVLLSGKTLIRVAYGDDYSDSTMIMNVLLIASLANNGLRYPTANLLAAMGQVRVNMVVSALGMLLQIVLNLILIPRFGGYGTAVCSAIVYSFMAVAVLIAFSRFNRPRLSNG